MMLNKKPDTCYEKRILQEMMQRSYIRFHPTTAYHRATPEIRQFYDGFEIYNFENRLIPQKPIDEDDAKHATLQQLLSISYHYAPNFFDTMKLKKMDYL
eukprot:2521792-Amphidinium_carterae.1